MQTRHLVTWVLVLLVGWVGVFGFFSKHFSGANLERMRREMAEAKIRKLERYIALREFSFQEYKDAVATAGLSIQDPAQKNETLRAIASVTAAPELKKKIEIEPGKSLFARATRLFKQNAYSESAEAFAEYVTNFSDSPRVPEATYLQAESYFGLRKFEEAVKAIDFLITHFPETDYSAYGLLRLAQIFEELERLEDATEVYNLIIQQYAGTHAEQMAKKLRAERDL